MKTPYKLKEEIKQFIIDKKRTELKLSCRGLVDLIKEQFGTEISKSSVNAVIQEQKLSSPVGRTRIKEKIIQPPLLLAETLPAATIPTEPLNAAAPELMPSAPVASSPEEKPQEQPPAPVLETKRLPEELPQIPVRPPGEENLEQPVEFKAVRKEEYYISNGGCFLLKIADLKFSLTPFLRDKFAVFLPDLPKDFLQTLVEVLIYLPLFKDKNSLWQFLGKEMSEENLNQYSRKLAQIPLSELGPVFTRLDPGHKINDINELYKECLFWLSSSVQEQFFPTVYQFLDFSTMHSRFYSLFARAQKRADLYAIQLFYPEGFAWVQDIVWQEDFVYVAKRINDEKILTASGEKIWLESSVKLFT